MYSETLYRINLGTKLMRSEHQVFVGQAVRWTQGGGGGDDLLERGGGGKGVQGRGGRFWFWFWRVPGPWLCRPTGREA